MPIFWNKNVKITSASGAPFPHPRLPPAAGGSAPRPPRSYSCFLLQICWVYFLR